MNQPGSQRDAVTPAVSIIVPAYNTAAYIGDTLASVFAQTRTDFEVIVVNDGSPDEAELEQVLAPYLDRIRYLRQPNMGLSAARNTGIAEARAPYIAILDSDDVLEPDYLAVQLRILEADPSIDVLSPDALLFGDSPFAGRRFSEVCPSRGDVTIESLVTQQCQLFVGVVARREALQRAGLFDPEIRSSEDFDMWLRVLATGGRIAYHDQVLVRHRKRRGSLSSDPVWMAQHAIKVLDKSLALPLTQAQREVMTERRAGFEAALHLEEGKRALVRRDDERALQYLETANEHFRSVKLTVVCSLLRLSPGLVRSLYVWWRPDAETFDHLSPRAGTVSRPSA